MSERQPPPVTQPHVLLLPNSGPRVAFLAFYFPPTRASGVHRSLATANHLAGAGWDVTVLTPQREFFRDAIRSYDPSLDARVRADVRVDRVPFRSPAWETDIRRFSRFRGNFPVAHRAVSTRLDRTLFPDPYARWIAPVVRRLLSRHRVTPFDVVLATGNPFSSFAAAWFFHRLTGVPYVLDYRDSWTLDQFADEAVAEPCSAAYRWESRVLSAATRAFFVNTALLEWHAQRYPSAAPRMRVVQNGYEPDDVRVVERGRRPGNGLRFGYVGTLTPQTPVEALADGWLLARSEDPALENATVELYGYLGFFPAAVEATRARLPDPSTSAVHYRGPVRKADLARVYQSLDALLLVHGGGRYVTSGKVFEYMATGRPVVSVHHADSAAAEVLSGYPLWFPAADLSAPAVAEALSRAAHAATVLTDDQVRAARDHARTYTRTAQLEVLERELCEVARG
jgi:glycosyltransferase involved in cell wall biosynthesis